MTIEPKETWIQAGYETFALSGPGGLKVEPLAKKVGISKSSFYHHFADLELFLEVLLKHHLQQAHIIAHKEQQAKNIDPEGIQIIITHKTDLLFNRQLRIHQNNNAFANTLLQSDTIVGDAFKLIWIRDINLPFSHTQIDHLFTLALESFFLQINADNLHYQWLSGYFANLKQTAKQLSNLA
jgi:AcrR family transcriptional regulator